MAWSTPRTWSIGETLTAANMNTYVSNNLSYLFSPSNTGATAASRYMGAVSTAAAPTTGTFNTGDFVIGQTGHLYVCTAGGSPGTWADVGQAGVAGVSSWNSRTGAVVPANNDYAIGAISGASTAGNVPRSNGTTWISTTLSSTDLSDISGSTGTGSTLMFNTAPSLSASPATSDNSTKVATTAYVKGQGYGTGSVSSVFGRTGAVLASSGDYTAAQITNAADKSSSSQQAFTASLVANSLYTTTGTITTGGAGTFSIDYSQGGFHSYTCNVTGTQAVTIANPTNAPTSSQSGMLTLRLFENVGTGSMTFSWGSAYFFSQISKPTSLSAGSFLMLVFVYDPVSAVWRAVAEY